MSGKAVASGTKKTTKDNVVMKKTTKTTQTTVFVAAQSSAVNETSKAAKPRKRSTLTLTNGDVLDLSKKLTAAQASYDVVEAMRLRILELEEDLMGPPTKRRKTTGNNYGTNPIEVLDDEPINVFPSVPMPVPMPTATATTTASVKAEEKMKRAHLKKIFDRLKKDLKADDVKFKTGNSTNVIKSDFVMQRPEFDAVFGGKGLLIQPTRTNKPNSTVTIMNFDGEADIQDLFGAELKQLQGNKWVARSLFEPKARKIGNVDVVITKVEANYASASMKLTLKIEVVDPNDFYDGFAF